MIGKKTESPIFKANQLFEKAAEQQPPKPRILTREERDNQRRAELGGYKMYFLPIERFGSGLVRQIPRISSAPALDFGGSGI